MPFSIDLTVGEKSLDAIDRATGASNPASRNMEKRKLNAK
jgi:hypothetical protein